MERLKQRGADLVCRCGKGHSEPLQSDKYSSELVLTPLELIDRIAQLVPPPRAHRHRYYSARREALGPIGAALETMWDDALWRLKLRAELEQTRRGPKATRRRRRTGP